MAVTPRTLPVLLNVPLGPAPPACPWSQRVFLPEKLSANSLPHPNPGSLSCCGMAADSKGQTLAPPHAFSPSQTLSPCSGEDGALLQCPHHVRPMGHLSLCFRQVLFNYHWVIPERSPVPVSLRPPSPGFTVTGGITLSPFCLPVATPAFILGAANLTIQQPPAPHCHHSKTPRIWAPHRCHVSASAHRQVHAPEPILAVPLPGSALKPSPAGSRQLGNEA